MRKIKRITRLTSVGTALFCVATWGNVAAANENARIWPRLGANAVAAGETGASSGAVETGETSAAGARGAVESADFVGYSENSALREQENALGGRARSVGWTSGVATAFGGVQAVEPSAKTSGFLDEVGGNEGDRQNVAAAKIGEIGENSENKAGSARPKTPILRDEPASTARNGGSWAGALVSTFGALAVVLGAFCALIAVLRRTGAPVGVGRAAEIVDSTVLGDKTRLLTIRWGNRLILAAKTPEKIAPLAEIADADEANALLAEIERRKQSGASGSVGEKTAALWKRGREAANVWRSAVETKGQGRRR